MNLEISELGAYRVDGKPVEREALIEALSVKRQPGKQLLVHLIPSPKTKYETVQAAVVAVRQVGGSSGMVGNERF